MPSPRVYNKHHGDAPPGATYIGRGSPWGNRFVIGDDGDRDQACNRFECEQLPDMDVSSLAGRDLVCFCAPHRCHGDSILLKANFRVVVFGGRNYAARGALYRALDAVHARRKITCIVVRGKRLEPTGWLGSGLRTAVSRLIHTRPTGTTSIGLGRSSGETSTASSTTLSPDMFATSRCCGKVARSSLSDVREELAPLT